jgi:integrase
MVCYTLSGQSAIQLSGQPYRNFIETVHSPFSRAVYSNSLKLYMQYMKVEDCDQLLQGDPRLIQSQLVDYIIYLREEKKVVANTINTTMAAIKKFYDTNDFDLKWKKIKSYVGRGKNKKNKRDRPYTHFEIQKMLEKADQRGRISILLMASAGLRIGALPSLKIRNLEKIDRYNLYKITAYEGEDEEYTTFCTPECTAAVDSYLEYRQRHGEHPLKEDSPLIRQEFDINDEIRAANPKGLGAEAFRRMVKGIGFRSGVIEKRATPKGELVQRRPVKETHGFRKFFQTTAITSGMSPLYAEFLMGHTSGGLALEAYVRPSQNDLLEDNDKMIGYIGVIDALTVNEEHKLRREVEHYKVKASQFDSLKAEIDELKELIGK